MEGKIIKVISNNYSVLVDNNIFICKPRGKLRIGSMIPVTGDNVIIDEKNKYILEIKERKNSLIRPMIANIDQVVIITSAKDPDFSSNLLDKLITVIEYNNIKPIICFTKLDLLKDKSNINNVMNYYKKIGYDVYTNNDINEISKIFKNKITAFTGQSGAGKSTLLNKLDSSLDLKTDEISYALGRGKHTTRHVELLNLYDGWVADTPGFSSIDLSDMSNIEIRDTFIEFKNECKYRDCMHINECDCEVKKQIGNDILASRYENYIKFIRR